MASSSSTELEGKVFVVTGASSGLGEAVAILAASRGACVTLCGQNEARLESARTRCVSVSGGRASRFATVRGDLTQAETRSRVVSTTVDTFGRMDALIANAGLNEPNCGILTATEAVFDKVININVKAVFFLIQEAVPILEKSKGCIVSVSSQLSNMAATPNIIYPMSKAAIDHMTRCLALDLASRGIRVNAVNPSFVPTRIRRYAGTESDNDREVAATAASESTRHPLQNRCLTKEELAEAAVFLGSDRAGFITGQCLVVDGGRQLAGPFIYSTK